MGMLRAGRYAFGPNRLHYCGPERPLELKDRIITKGADEGLRDILTQFEAMYPYLLHIARANNIADPLDERVVEAYWVGNALLEHVTKDAFYVHLADGLSLKKKYGTSFEDITRHIGRGALPHHSFHVFDVWKKGEEIREADRLNSIDECRVSWGEVTDISGPFITIMTPRLIIIDGKLALGVPEPRRLVRALESEYEIEQIVPGNILTVHWGVACEVISPKQLANLKHYTLRHIALANQELWGI